MIHDFKTYERRATEGPLLVAWCVCGGWRYTSTNLTQAPAIDGFIEHLEIFLIKHPETLERFD